MMTSKTTKTNATLWSVYKDYTATMKSISTCRTQMPMVYNSQMRNIKDMIKYARVNGCTNVLKKQVERVRDSIKRDYNAHPSVAAKCAIDFCNRAIASL